MERAQEDQGDDDDDDDDDDDEIRVDKTTAIDRPREEPMDKKNMEMENPS